MTATEGLTFTVEGWQRITASMRQLEPKVKRKMRRRFRKPAEQIRDAARENARQQGLVLSGGLVKSIKVRINKGGIAVAAGGKSAPHARVHEEGGRWPVFADGENRREWTWFPEGAADSPARPFFAPAVANPGAGAVATELADVVSDVGAQLGLEIVNSRFRAPSLRDLI